MPTNMSCKPRPAIFAAHRFSKVAACAAFGMASMLVASCATPPPQHRETRVEKVDREKVIGGDLAAQVEKNLKIGRDSELEVYLRKLTLKLAAKQPDLADAGAGVILVHPVGGKWRSFALPGNRVYLSIEFLKKLSFESEVAAAIALQLAHLTKGQLLDRIYDHKPAAKPVAQPSADIFSSSTPEPEFAPQANALPKSIDFFGPGGAFDFTEEQMGEAISAAVPILYDSGFDPRGISSIWKTYIRNVKKSPYDDLMLHHAEDRTLTALAQRPPLRNPVVNEESFRKMLARIQRL